MAPDCSTFMESDLHVTEVADSICSHRLQGRVSQGTNLERSIAALLYIEERR